MRFGSFVNFARFAKDHRLTIVPRKRKIGILYALAGWGLIAVTTTFFKEPSKAIPLEVNFFLQFITGSLVLLLGCCVYGLYKGQRGNWYRFLEISNANQVFSDTCLSVRQRVTLIYSRGMIATGGYIAYQLAKPRIGILDTAAIHGADALMYALMAVIILKERFKLFEWLGVLISGAGVSFVLYFDIGQVSFAEAVLGFILGITSSISLAIIIILSTVIVRHDHPVRVAFHQCLCGVILAFFILLCSGEMTEPSDLLLINCKNAIATGALYALALICFFSAFLYVEPIINAISGYSLVIYIAIFESILYRDAISIRTVVSSVLICLGTGLLIRQEYKKDKTKI